MKTSIKIATLLDIPIKIHFTFIFILGLFAWAFSIETFTLFGFTIGFGDYSIPLGLKAFLGALVAIFLFICVLLHELGHSYITQKYGHTIKGITLFIFGGSSESEEIPKDPKKEISIAIAGPLVSIIIGLGLYAATIPLELFTNSLFIMLLYSMVETLAFYNIILAGFNLIPAFPIDGGRILRAALAFKMNYQKATKTAASIAKGIAIAMAIFGLFFNLWLTLIAIFIFLGASQEQKTTEISDALKGKKINDIMKKDIETASPELSLQQLFEKMENTKQFVYPVVENQQLVGVITAENLKKRDQDEWEDITVEDIMTKDVSTVSADEDAFTVFKTLIKKNLERIFVKDSNDHLVGMISRNDLLQSIQFYGIEQQKASI